jgi:dTDP-4-dehydrorhamnose 3,5-epimerase
MIFKETSIPGAYIIDLERLEDERGFFARSWCQREFIERGLDPCVVQCNISYNRSRGTLRGMHLQLPPFAEAKLVRCIRGAIYDVILDLRLGSPTYLQWFGIELSDENYTSLFIPQGLAHGFITLYDEAEIFYQMSEFYSPECAVGVRWNDPCFNIRWPAPVRVISAKDQAYPDFDPDRYMEVRYEVHSSNFSIRPRSLS